MPPLQIQAIEAVTLEVNIEAHLLKPTGGGPHHPPVTSVCNLTLGSAISFSQVTKQMHNKSVCVCVSMLVCVCPCMCVSVSMCWDRWDKKIGILYILI